MKTTRRRACRVLSTWVLALVTLMPGLILTSPAVAAGCAAWWAKKQYCQASPTTRVRFATGSTSKTVTGELVNLYDQDTFVFRARKGQHATISVGSAPGSVRIFVYRPSGQLLDGAPGGVDIASLPVSGDYRIRTHESQMGEPWSGKYALTVTIK